MLNEKTLNDIEEAVIGIGSRLKDSAVIIMMVQGEIERARFGVLENGDVEKAEKMDEIVSLLERVIEIAHS